MEYNIAKQAYLDYNLVSGTKTLNFNQTLKLLDYSLEAITTLTGTDILFIECDLQDRVLLKSVQYYFDSSFSSDTIASGIVFKYKDNQIDSYTTGTTLCSGSCYYTTTSGSSLFAPRYIQCIHRVNSLSGTLHGFKIIVDDSVVDFGVEGTVSSGNISIVKGQQSLYTYPIYNRSSRAVTANIQLNRLGTYIDDYICISSSESGPWVSIEDSEYVVTDNTSWELGVFGDNLVVDDGYLTLTGEETTGVWASNIFEAYYTTKIFRFSDVYNSPLLVDCYNEKGGTISVDFDDSVKSMGIKALDKPLDYIAYRIPHQVSGYAWSVADYNILDNSLLHVTSDNIVNTYMTYAGIQAYYFNTNCDTNITACATGVSSGAGDYLFLTTINADYTVKATKAILTSGNNNSQSTFGIVIYNVEPEPGGGVWINFVSQYYGGGDVTQTGYYLIHYDYTLTNTLKMVASERQIYDISLVRNSSTVWVANIALYLLSLITADGETLAYVNDDTTTDLRGCVSTEDGGCWYVNSNSLYRVNSEGVLLDSIENITTTGKLGCIKTYGTDLLVRDGEKIVKINASDSKGTIMFSVSLNTADKITVDSSNNIWVSCKNGYLYLLEGSSGAVVSSKNLNTASGQYFIPAFIKYTVNDSVYEPIFPIASDSNWVDSDFNKVEMDSYCISASKYNQALLTLRTNHPYDVYNVPYSVDTWSTEDYFNNETGYDLPYEHRWKVVAETITVDTVSGTCTLHGRYDPVTTPVVQLHSKDKWYVKAIWCVSHFDIQLGYIVPPDNDSNFRLWIKVFPHIYYNNSYNDSYYYGIVLDRTSGVMTMWLEYYYNYYGRTYTSSSPVTISPSELSGKIRIVRGGASSETSYLQAYLWKDSTSSWSLVSQSAAYLPTSYRRPTYGDEENYYVGVEYVGTKNITLDSFKVNIGDVYWYTDPIKIGRIFVRDYLKIPNIYPNNYKNVYFKLDVPEEEVRYTPNVLHNYTLKTWWEQFE